MRRRVTTHKIEPACAQHCERTRHRHRATRRHGDERPSNEERHPELYRIRRRLDAATGHAEAALPHLLHNKPAGCSANDQPAAEDRVEQMSVMRKKIAEHMVMSRRTSAHVTTVYEIDMTRISEITRSTQRRVPGAHRHQAHLHAVYFSSGHKRDSQIPNLQLTGQRRSDHLQARYQSRHGRSPRLGLIVPVIKRADDLSYLGPGSCGEWPCRSRTHQTTETRRSGRWNFHGHKSGRLWRTIRNSDNQPTAVGDSRCRQNREARQSPDYAGRRGLHRDSFDGIFRADLRSSRNRWFGCGKVSGLHKERLEAGEFTL